VLPLQACGVGNVRVAGGKGADAGGESQAGGNVPREETRRALQPVIRASGGMVLSRADWCIESRAEVSGAGRLSEKPDEGRKCFARPGRNYVSVLSPTRR
jgi:hypothetical protein